MDEQTKEGLRKILLRYNIDTICNTLEPFGIKIKYKNGKYKSMNTILNELCRKWDKINFEKGIDKQDKV